MSDRLRGAMARLNELTPNDAVYERAKEGPAPTPPDEGPGRSKRLMAAAIAFAVFVPAAIFAWQAFNPEHRTSPQSATPPASTPPVSATPAPGLLPNGLAAVFHAPGDITAIAAVGDKVYLSTSQPKGAQGAERTIVRWNASGGPTLQSEPLPGDGLAIAGGSLWAPGGSPRNDSTQGLPQAPWLYQLDPKTLAITAKFATGSPPDAIAASSSGMLWVGAGTRVLVIDPLKAKVAHSVSVQGHVHLLAIDPSGSHLYVSTDARVANSQNLLLELDTATGAVLASSGAGVSDLGGPSSLAATDAGVWVTTPTGMAGGAYFMPEGLRQETAAMVPGSNATNSSLAGGVLWVSDGSNPLVCADPITGRVRARIPMVGDAAVYGPVTEGPGLYIAAFDWLVRIVQPPTACGVPDSLIGHG